MKFDQVTPCQGIHYFNFEYSQPCLNATSEQRPLVKNGQFDTSTTRPNLTFIRPLFHTATILGPKGGHFTQVHTQY